MSKTNLNKHLHLHLLVFIWGFTAILGALISIDAVPLVWYRMLIASALTLVYFLIRKKPLKVPPKALIKFMITGLLIAIHWIAFFSAIKVANVSVALVTMSTGALFASLIEPLFFRRRIRFSEIFFGAVVMAGLYIIFRVDSGYSLGIVYALIAAALSALFSVLNGLYIQRYEAGIISFYQLSFGVVFISAYLLFNNGFIPDTFVLKGHDLLYLLILGSICTAYAFIASINIMKYLTPYTVMLTVNLEPVYGILLAVLIFGEKEKMSPAFYLGGAIIMLTVIANGLLNRKKNP
ncbi:MAG: EamA family transporter [Lutibacter sp.]|jgi:drug/metabolite transporter (DMT)-like permease|nr:EamA family transporter [Lutibacter sp.]